MHLVNPSPACSSSLSLLLRRFFVGGAQELDDDTYARIPSEHSGRILNKIGFRTVSGGDVCLTLNVSKVRCQPAQQACAAANEALPRPAMPHCSSQRPLLVCIALGKRPHSAPRCPRLHGRVPCAWTAYAGAGKAFEFLNFALLYFPAAHAHAASHALSLSQTVLGAFRRAQQRIMELTSGNDNQQSSIV